MMARMVQRMNARFGRPTTSLRAHPMDCPGLDETKQLWERQLAQLLALQLLQPSCLLPIDSKTLHDRVRVHNTVDEQDKVAFCAHVHALICEHNLGTVILACVLEVTLRLPICISHVCIIPGNLA
eukprot:1161282-Pelagomonas_calceolata.AAC.8